MFDKIQKAQAAIQQTCDQLGHHVRIMEVCGTHTVAIFRSGIKSILPKGLRLISGPGCPVCVTDQGYIDLVLQLADRDDTLIATYGDMIRVPGGNGSLETRQSRGNVRVVLSTDDALNLAVENPAKTVVFVAVGFETTTPATAVAVKGAAARGLDNFTILSNHKLVIPAMTALLSDPQTQIDGFLCPGHVSVILGYGAYRPIVEQFARPCVVAGFEPIQILEGLAEICRQVADKRAQVANVYCAVVTEQGNATARQIVDECFEPADGYWRGLGSIPGSTLKLRATLRHYDAFERFGITETPAEDLTGCRCGQVLCGRIEPPQCPLFAGRCTPDTPVGACMVSSEGTCAAWFKYGDRR